MNLRATGKEHAAKLFKEITSTTPTRTQRIRSVWKSSHSTPTIIPFSANDALSLVVEAKLSKHQYLLIRSQAKERNINAYPSYKKILQSKEECYPSKKDISITESSMEIKLQALLDHTITRIVLSQEPVFTSALSDQLCELVLISKWGCDETTGQSDQRTTERDFSDQDLFISSLVPLQLYSPRKGKIFWQNPRPSSTRFCRPIRIQFKKETTDLVKEETEAVEKQIETLQPTTCEIGEKKLVVSHNLLFTMIDGKFCNAVTSISSAQVCYVCGASPRRMNNIDDVLSRKVDESTFRFGLSILHAWIRFFECLLHISYRLEIKKWQVRGPADRSTYKTKKDKVQEGFRRKMGLLVDKPKPGGSGTSNDGNTARRFFKDPALSSKITGVDQEIISRFGVILQTISSAYHIDPVLFDVYAIETAKLYVQIYPWFYMPASVHKILVHGSKIISTSLLPIGQLSEEAQEARNKDVKHYREHHSRKMSRKVTNEDLLHTLLISSDPLISSARRLPRKPKKTLSPDVLNLLAAPKGGTSNIEVESSRATVQQNESSSEDSSGSSSPVI